jgi:hypothetical protein
MTLTTRSRSVAVVRPFLLKPSRPLIIKSRLCQRYARDYYTNPTDAFSYIRSPGKIKCGLYIIAKHIYIIISRNLLT